MGEMITARWLENLQFEVEDEAGHTIRIDAAEAHGGGTAFKPTDLLMVSLAGCTAMDAISILRKKRQQVTGFEVIVRGERAGEHPRKFLRLEVEYVVRGVEVSPKAVERSIELSATKYCPVQANLAPTVEIHHTYRIVEETASDG